LEAGNFLNAGAWRRRVVVDRKTDWMFGGAVDPGAQRMEMILPWIEQVFVRWVSPC
jgi:hypothetical protein